MQKKLNKARKHFYKMYFYTQKIDIDNNSIIQGGDGWTDSGCAPWLDSSLNPPFLHHVQLQRKRQNRSEG